MRTAADWNRILVQCQVKPLTAAKWAPIFATEILAATFSAGDSEVDDFLGQVLHESAMLGRLEEDLSYSAERLTQVWPMRFQTAAMATPFARNPEALANKVYGGRLGNTQPGDGWRYRGRGLIQVTGLDNYRLVSQAIGIDLVAHPERLADPAIALRASIAWWEKRIPDEAMGNIVRVSKLVNGGTVGLKHRDEVTSAARKGLA